MKVLLTPPEKKEEIHDDKEFPNFRIFKEKSTPRQICQEDFGGDEMIHIHSCIYLHTPSEQKHVKNIDYTHPHVGGRLGIQIDF